ncbi:cupredoxin domain-containing protein [Azospirillum isscasi]|uniref:Plastocyanin/azurin family copper-binding protein n=1 Tax=Azospirillum isscasi TaxID=3053926 RepID=A0ABU0WF18_9PROT|nr:plastocyanin/azurin family copper-binding protein [Azospirillum isscasi]MDQ2102785.1 plastocyanin/azurin family copper-binding protein [Azospirillum isscasi]
MRLYNRTLSTVAALMTGTTLIAAPAAAFAAPGEAGHKHDTAAIGEPAKATAKTRTIQITMGDNYYEPNAVQVKAGETVRFLITNKGEFLHEFNIGTAAMHAAHQKEMATMMEHGMLTPTGINKGMAGMDHSRMPGMEGVSMKHDDPNSALIEPGKIKDLTWKFTKNTTLEFACNIPGHYESGMVGKVDVQR